MSTKIYSNARFGFRSDTLHNWQIENPILEKGEPSIVSNAADEKWLKIGDGVTHWNDLPWYIGPKGDKGEDGTNGQDGVSATHSWNGTVLTVTSASGTSSADLKGDQGIQGDTGSSGVYVGTEEPTDEDVSVWIDSDGTADDVPGGGNGADGKDGFSPVVEVTETDNGHTVSITDVNGTQTFEVLNGEKGDTGATGATGAQGEKGDKGDKGDKGEEGYTPQKGVDYFDGKDGTNGQDGEDGLTPFINDNGNWQIGDTDTGVKAAGTDGTNGKDGYTPVKGKDFYTEADQEAIVQQVITALGTPVFGTVDENKVVTLTGTLADGTYTFVYEDENGEVTTIGEYAKESGPTYTNQIPLSINADGTPYVGINGEDGYNVGYRIKSDGTEVAQSGINCTGFIPAVVTDSICFSTDMKFINDASNNTKIALYDEEFAHIGYVSSKGLIEQGMGSTQVTSEGLGVDAQGNIVKLTPLCLRYWHGTEAVEKTAYFRVATAGITSESIITVNQPIE